jgi:hypothetical protein
MAKLKGVRERVHQPFFDSLVRGIGITTIANQFQLFGAANVGQPDLTNLQIPGVLASDQTYIVKAVRCVMWFQSLNDPEFNTAFGTLPAITTSLGSNSRAEDLYMLMAYGGYFNLSVGNKPMLNGPLWYIPAGGGVSGFTTENNRHVLSNGVATQEAILKLAKDIHVPARQNFACQINFFPYAVRGAGQGGAIASPVNPLDCLNQFDGMKLIQIHLDGVQTRDVQ